MNKDKAKPKLTQKSILHYLKALTETAREPFLLLDSKLKVLAASPFFYKTFRVSPKQTEKHFVYDLGNRQWNIEKLKKMLENILPNKKIVTDFEVTHNFPKIGKRTVKLNARQIDKLNLIIIAFEDITAKKEIEEEAAEYTRKLEKKVSERTEKLEERIRDLKKLSAAFVGRELKIVELKRIVAELEKQVKKINHNPVH